MNNTSRLLITLMSSCAVLSACGGGGGGSGDTAAVTTTRLYATDVGTAANALADGETLTTQTNGSSAILLNYVTGETGPLSTPTVKVWKNANGQFSYSVDGVVQDFTTDDLYDEWTYEVIDDAASKTVSLWLQTSGTLDEVLNETPTDYSVVWGYETNQLTPSGKLRGFAAVGAETLPSDIEQMTSATYSGRGQIEVYPAAGYEGGGSSRTRVRSDVTLSADFSAATIAGQMTNITVQPPGGSQTAIAGAIDMNEAPISGNGFAGTLTPNAELIAGVEGDFAGSGTYGGTFYGPAAEEATGTMTWTSTLDGETSNGVGFFQTFKD